MRTRGWRVAAGAWIVLAVVGLAAASAQPAPMAFTVSTPDPASQKYHVRLRCEAPSGADTAEFRMPAWTPGYYGLFDFAGNVRNFEATDGEGNALAVSRSGPNGWLVRKGDATSVVLTYEVVATNNFVANAFLDQTRAYILPGALFVYVPGQLQRPVTVTIELHPKWSAVATGLDADPGGPAHTYRAADFDVLYDSPILACNLESLPPFEIHGVPHRFVGHALGEFDRQLFIDDLQAIVEAGINVIGDIPYEHYTFIGIGPGRGGIEHTNSTTVSFTGVGSDRASRIRTLSFLAHEYFHHYNVKRIRPIELGPFDYDNPNPTDMLWVSEGFTSYYQHLMLARSGRMTQQELLDALGRTIAATENNTGRLFQPVTVSSRETWTQGPFGRGGNGIRKTVSYYEKGAVLGLLLDFRIRHATRNAKSLDTVMRALYERYYKRLGRGWTSDEFQRTCEDVAGTELTEIFDYASTTRPIDYAKYLSYAGLRVEEPRQLEEADLGVIAEDVEGSLAVAAVEPGSAAEKAGIAAGDAIASVDGTTVDAAGLKAAIGARKPGDRVKIIVRRGSGEQAIDSVLDARLERTWRLVPVPNPDDLQRAILVDWAAVTVKPTGFAATVR
jgi:predicted metalloprotease with PDZ domain